MSIGNLKFFEFFFKICINGVYGMFIPLLHSPAKPWKFDLYYDKMGI